MTIEVTNPACGDILRLSARFDGGAVAEARYKTKGCTASIAAGSALTEWMEGKSKSDLSELSLLGLRNGGGAGARKKHAAVLCADAVRQLLRRALEAAL